MKEIKMDLEYIKGNIKVSTKAAESTLNSNNIATISNGPLLGQDNQKLNYQIMKVE